MVPKADLFNEYMGHKASTDLQGDVEVHKDLVTGSVTEIRLQDEGVDGLSQISELSNLIHLAKEGDLLVLAEDEAGSVKENGLPKKTAAHLFNDANHHITLGVPVEDEA